MASGIIQEITGQRLRDYLHRHPTFVSCDCYHCLGKKTTGYSQRRVDKGSPTFAIVDEKLGIAESVKGTKEK